MIVLSLRFHTNDCISFKTEWY